MSFLACMAAGCVMLLMMQVVTKLHAILRPFLLRRVKSDVETDLPAKKEIILYAGMTDVQRKLHSELREKTLAVSRAKAARYTLCLGNVIGMQHRLHLELRKSMVEVSSGLFAGGSRAKAARSAVSSGRRPAFSTQAACRAV